MVTVPRFEEVAGRVLPETHHDDLGVALVTFAGLSSFFFHWGQLRGETGDQVTLLFGTVIPMALSMLLIIGGAWLRRLGYDGLKLRVGMWCLVGVGILTGISLVIVQHQTAHGVELREIGTVIGAPATAGGVVGLLIGMYDGERTKTERRMGKERQKAERLSRRLTVLNRVLRHDIRNDVNVIHGNANRILDETDAQEPAATIKNKAVKLNRLSESAREIESLLEREELSTEPVDIASVLQDERQSMVRYSSVELESSIPEEAWAVASPKIETAIGHIVENAVEHNDCASPWVRIEAGVDGDHVEVRIVDDGPGLPEKEIRVLERGHETSVEHASGLGLWLANWIVTESGGEVTFGRDEPRGSTVVIRLPRANVEA
jgi:signal transduction histidine kinase